MKSALAILFIVISTGLQRLDAAESDETTTFTTRLATNLSLASTTSTTISSSNAPTTTTTTTITTTTTTSFRCGCKLRSLKELESLEKSWRRLRVENPNGLSKYPTNNDSLMVGCHTLAVYEKTVHKNALNKSQTIKIKRCRECSDGGGGAGKNSGREASWSDLKQCETLRCDRDDLSGAPIFKLAYSEIAPPQQTLFTAGRVFAIYPARKCRECLSTGDWSAKTICSHTKITTPRPPQFCSLDELVRIEFLQFSYVRLRIESPDGWTKIVENDVSSQSRRLPADTVVVYQRYLSLLANIQQDMVASSTHNPFKQQMNPFTRKFCRYCDAASGKWSDLDSCVSLSCDPAGVLGGSPEFVLLANHTTININNNNNNNNINNNNMGGKNTNLLFKPFSVLAVYSFGSEKTCKQCHENGEWSKYASSELCHMRGGIGAADRIEFTKHANNDDDNDKNEDQDAQKRRSSESERWVREHLHKLEQPCRLSELGELEEAINATTRRIMLVSPDRRRQLDPIETTTTTRSGVRVPSRTLSIYASSSSSSSSNQTSVSKSCSICVNGVWSWPEWVCGQAYEPNLEYCRRDEIEPLADYAVAAAAASKTPSSRAAVFLLEDESEAPLSQSLFEPGTVKVVYRLSETTTVCRACQPDGKWTRFAHTRMCEAREAFAVAKSPAVEAVRVGGLGAPSLKASCLVKDLDKEAEEDNIEFVRETIQSWDGRSIFEAASLASPESFVPDLSMAVFAKPTTPSSRRLKMVINSNSTLSKRSGGSAGASRQLAAAGSSSSMRNASINNQKYCRRCVDGKWEDVYAPCPIEFSTVKCDPSKLRGVTYFVYVSDGFKLATAKATASLVYPGEMAAVYEFGVQKYCKICNQDGSWSSYPQFQLCDLVNWSS